eukprot:1953716-Lingulodinium_polyedra.AAC.1
MQAQLDEAIRDLLLLDSWSSAVLEEKKNCFLEAVGQLDAMLPGKRPVKVAYRGIDLDFNAALIAAFTAASMQR